MRTYLAAAILIGALAGCSSDQDSSVGHPAEAASEASRAVQAAIPFGTRASSSSFASLPDRGELFAYQYVRPVKRGGAYTAYPVGISEAHALRAIQTGQMTINAPNGELIRLRYERHVEHPDGNWTWIGRDPEGADAVITFGEKAVFGSIPQGADAALRLTMSAGQSWLVQTDRSKLAGLDGTKGGQPTDQLVPPKIAAEVVQRQLATMESAQATANATASTAVIDVLIGYTNGYASQFGSASAAVTRLTNMVAIANEAYANSGVNMRVRLVKAMQVNYPDNTSNSDALEELTGYESGDDGRPIDPDPAFEDLRKARDDSGADLVSLVRAFRTPENEGCGIAWLIGGDQAGISTADAPFGYSVISDGTDEDEDDGNDYYCRDETLAHEIGHNMGQAHDEEDSDSAGVHTYSYGYRESSSTGFYTVMAYPKEDSSQYSIRYFANPLIKYKNRPTGVANQSDNVRSMNQTMPIVSQFRSTVVPLDRIRNDFNGDGKSDILWRNTSSGRNMYWGAAKYSSRKNLEAIDSQAWTVAGIGDFGGDGKSDILWWNRSTSDVLLWPDADYDERKRLSDVSYNNWVIAGVGDLTGDGRDDIVWRNTQTGSNNYWNAGNPVNKVSLHTIANQGWKIVGIGDFDGDGMADILWRNAAQGRNMYWGRGSYDRRVTLHEIAGNDWRVAGVGDFDGNGKADIFWRNVASGKNIYWKGAQYSALVSLETIAGNSWSIEQFADYDGDGRTDVLWRKTTGSNVYWGGAVYDSRKVLEPIAGQDWKIVP